MPSPFLEKIFLTGFSCSSHSSTYAIGAGMSFGRGLNRGRLLCFLGGKLKVAVLYLAYSPVCQGRVAGFFGF